MPCDPSNSLWHRDPRGRPYSVTITRVALPIGRGSFFECVPIPAFGAQMVVLIY
jgi:hypothetical protein